MSISNFPNEERQMSYCGRTQPSGYSEQSGTVLTAFLSRR